MNNQATKKMTDKEGKPIVCLKSDNGNSAYVPNRTKAIDIECLSPLSDKDHKLSLSDEETSKGCFAKRSFTLNPKGTRKLLLRVLDQAKADWYAAKKKLERDADDSEAYETLCEVEDFLVGEDYRKYREICELLPENPLQMFLIRWEKTHFWEEEEKQSKTEID